MWRLLSLRQSIAGECMVDDVPPGAVLLLPDNLRGTRRHLHRFPVRPGPGQFPLRLQQRDSVHAHAIEIPACHPPIEREKPQENVADRDMADGALPRTGRHDGVRLVEHHETLDIPRLVRFFKSGIHVLRLHYLHARTSSCAGMSGRDLDVPTWPLNSPAALVTSI